LCARAEPFQADGIGQVIETHEPIVTEAASRRTSGAVVPARSAAG